MEFAKMREMYKAAGFMKVLKKVWKKGLKPSMLWQNIIS